MAKLKERVRAAGFNAGVNYYAKLMPVADIEEDPEIAGIFRIHDNTLESVVRSMRLNGYDRAEPVVLWKGKSTVVDGHTRVRAAIKVGITEIPVIEKEFESLEEAILYTFERQANRRNLEQAEIMAAAAALRDKAKDGSGRGAELLARKLNVAPSTLYRARKICVEAEEEDLKAIQDGKATINEVYKKVKSTKKENGEAGREFPASRENIRFLKSSVVLLVDKNEVTAAAVLVDHFLRKNERLKFYQSLSDAVRSKLPCNGVQEGKQ
jgi:ParB-like chromosome segregation protein Spo0J